MKLIKPRRFADERGWFEEVYSERLYADLGFTDTFRQDNHVLTRTSYVLRGLHFQRPPHAQAKLVSCLRGRIWDVAVDLRRGSPTYGRYSSAELSAENGLKAYIPIGFAHGYLTLEADCEVFYKVSDFYAPECEGGLTWDDRDLAIEWPLAGHRPALSEKDRMLGTLARFEKSIRMRRRRARDAPDGLGALTVRVLITGGAGFIGSALARHLISRTEHKVLVVDKLTYAGNVNSLKGLTDNPRYAFLRADICDRETLGRVFARFRPDVVAHLAAESHVDRSIDGPGDFLDTNIVGTFQLLQAALEHWLGLPLTAREQFRFHHVSTDEVFGSLVETGQFTESSRYDPRSPYAASKASADHLVRAWHHTYGLPVIVSNCSNNYGPYHFPEKLIPLIIIKALAEQPLPIYGDGSNVRDWLFVEDHAQALTRIFESGRVGETYLIGGRAEHTNLDVVRTICASLDRARPRRGGQPHEQLISFVPDRPGHDLRYAIDPTKLERELGWTPASSFADGIDATVRWYLNNEWWWRPLVARRYGGERLGLTGKPSVAEAR